MSFRPTSATWRLSTASHSELAYAAQATRQLEDINRFYAEVHRILSPAAVSSSTEYHPVRRNLEAGTRPPARRVFLL